MTNLSFYYMVELSLVVAAWRIWNEKNNECIGFEEWLNRKHEEPKED